MLIRSICLILFWLPSLVMTAQDVPPFRYYASQEYEASAQNWKIAHSPEGTLFFANNDGVVVAQGTHWSLLPSVNKSIVRSVFVDEGRVYVGMYMEFGFYQQDEFGHYVYTSLSRRPDSAILEDEQFWNIFKIGGQIVFQSLDQIMIYLPGKESVVAVKPPQPILQGFSSGQHLFIQDIRKDVYELINGVWQLTALGPAFGDAQLVLMHTRFDGLFEAVDEWGKVYQQLSGKWSVVRDLSLRDQHIYSASRLDDGGFVLGTISDGIRVYDEHWNLRYSLGKDNGISNNTVLSLHQDAIGNIWLGLDNGLMCVNHDSPLSGYTDQENELGTVYASARHGDMEYLGTNIGLFYRSIPDKGRLRLIPGSSGQVWNLQVIGGRLLLGHHKGSFEVVGDKLISTGAASGTWKFVELEQGKTLIAGTYRGIDVIKMTDGQWRWSHKMSGFNLSSRHLEPVDGHTWLVSHEYKGVFRLETDQQWNAITAVRMMPDFGKGIYSSLAGFDGAVWYYCPGGLYRYNEEQSDFERQDWADHVLDSGRYYSGKMVPLGKEALCFFRSGSLVMMRREVSNDAFRFDVFPAAVSQLKPMRGFENVSDWGERLLLGGVNRYFLLNTGQVPERPKAPLLYSCQAGSVNGPEMLISLRERKIPGSSRSVRFRFGTPSHQAYQEMQYQYRLIGVSDNWSAWSPVAEVIFNSLSSGAYTLQVRSSLAGKEPSAVTEFTFEMDRHWALSPAMIFVYLLGTVLLIFAIHRSYTGYYRSQRRKLMEENEKNLRLNQLTLEQDYAREKNQFLENQFGRKKKELAQTMVHLNKNVELLSEVRDYLTRLAGEDHVRLLKKIEGNLADEDSWTLLETAFNQVDRDFLNKLREKFTDLSPSDLKLCVYLRLNLSSKEISTLLNISAKSVEIKRYRLRKKMGLDPQLSLQSFILGL